jgi:hypothetical protein
VAISAGGTLSAGTSIGTLTVNGDLTLQGNVLAEVSTDGGTPVADLVEGVANLTYGGTLTVSNIGTNALSVGNQFTLFSASGSTGGFDSIQPGTPGPGLLWNFDAATGVLAVTSTTPELGYSVVGGGTGIQFTWAGDFKLVSQTNGLGVGLTTNWFDYPDGTNGVVVPINSLDPAVFFGLQPQ